MRYNYLYLLIIPFILLWEPVLVKEKENKMTEASKSKKGSRKAEVEVKYNLLDDKGNPASRFKQGENFSFSFSLANNSGDSLFLDNSFLNESTGFCSVYDEKDNLIGTPLKFSGATIVESKAHPFFGRFSIYNLLIPWNDSRSNWSTLHYSFRGANQKCLPKGKYYTLLKHRFCFDRSSDKPSLCLDPVSLRIDFEII
jgi:hypothetical protein